jgi:hypothetical protein
MLFDRLENCVVTAELVDDAVTFRVEQDATVNSEGIIIV